MPKLYTSRFSNKELETGEYTVVGVVREYAEVPVKYRFPADIIQGSSRQDISGMKMIE